MARQVLWRIDNFDLCDLYIAQHGVRRAVNIGKGLFGKRGSDGILFIFHRRHLQIQKYPKSAHEMSSPVCKCVFHVSYS